MAYVLRLMYYWLMDCRLWLGQQPSSCHLHPALLQTYVRRQCTALHCTILYCITLHCNVLYCSALLCSTALHCIKLHCTALHCTVLHCTALHCTALHCTALLMVHFNTLNWVNNNTIYNLHNNTLHCIVLQYNILHCTGFHLRKVYPLFQFEVKCVRHLISLETNFSLKRG